MRPQLRNSSATILVAAIVIAACGTLPAPDDLKRVQSMMRDEAAAAEAKAAAPEQYQAALAYSQQASAACADNEKTLCQQASTLARIKMETAYEVAARIRAEKRLDAAQAAQQTAKRTKAVADAARRDDEKRISRMQRVAALQTKLSSATSAAEKSRTRLSLAREKASLEKEKLRRMQQRDALFNSAAEIVGPGNVKRTTRGIVVTVRELFASGKTQVREDRLSTVEALSKLAQQFADYPIVVEGYTDSRGKASANLALSQGRAQEIMNRLLSAGIKMDRIKALGYGEASPIADNSSREGRARNRRIEVIFLPQP